MSGQGLTEEEAEALAAMKMEKLKDDADGGRAVGVEATAEASRGVEELPTVVAYGGTLMELEDSQAVVVLGGSAEAGVAVYRPLARVQQSCRGPPQWRGG